MQAYFYPASVEKKNFNLTADKGAGENTSSTIEKLFFLVF